MALDLGELIARLGINSTELDRGLDEVPNKLKRAGAKAAQAGAAVGASIAVAMGGALVEAMSREAGSDKLAAQLGLSDADSARMGKVAGEVYAGAYGDSLGQVNDAIGAITLRVGEGSDAWLKTTTQSVLGLSATFDQEAGSIATAVGQMLTTGLAKNSGEALDIITRGFQVGNDKAGDFLDTLNEYGGQFQKLGVDGATATGLLSQGLQAGARDADLVADAFKEFSIRAVDGSTTSAAGFAALGLSAKDMTATIAAGGPGASAALDTVLDRLRGMKDPVAQSGAAVALFGSQAEDLGAALYALDPSAAVAGLGQVEGAVDGLNKTAGDNATTSLESFKRQIMSTFVDFVGGKALPIVNGFAASLATGLGPAVEAVTPAVQAAGAAAMALGAAIPTPILQGAAIVVGTLATVLGVQAAATAAASAATGIYTAVKAIFISTTNAETGAVTLSTLAKIGNTVQSGAAAVATGVWTAAQWLLNAALSANPLGLVTLAVAALVAGVVIAYRESETFRNIVTGAWDAVQGRIVGGWNIIRDNALSPLVNFVGTTIPSVFSAGVDAVGRTWDLLTDKLRTPIRVAFDFVNSNVIGPVNAILGKFPGGLSVPSLPHLASGGLLRGPGTGTSDSILGVDPRSGAATAAVSNGEFVVNQRQTARNLPLLQALNAGKVGGYALGGLVGGLVDKAGGVLGEVKDAAKAVGGALLPDFVGEMAAKGARKAAELVLGPMRSAVAGMLPDQIPLNMVRGGLDKMFDAVLSKSDEQDKLSASLMGGAFGRGGGGSPDGQGGLGPVAAALRAAIIKTFGITNIGGYAYRMIAGTNTLSDHATGHAADVMIANYKSPAGIAQGNSVASWILQHAADYKLRYLIWRDQINSGSGWRPYGHPGGGRSDTLQHRDHVHASVYDKGGWLEPGGVAMNAGRGRELVTPAPESREIVDHLRALRSGQAGGAQVHYHGDFYSYDPADIEAERAKRERDAAAVFGLVGVA